MNGINTISHDITPKPLAQSIFKTIVKSIITINFKKAVLYIVLNISIIICVVVKTTYNNAGEHKFCIIY